MLTQEFWDTQHRQNSRYWLTDSIPAHVLAQHRVGRPTNKRVMDIGVGTGGLVTYLAKYGNTMIACDISPVALERVRYTAQVVLPKDLLTVEPVDLAICHLVFQHCVDATMFEIIRNVRLTETGLFSFQFAYLAGPPSNSIQVKMDAEQLVFRPLEHVLSGIERVAPWFRVVDLAESTMCFEGTSVGWSFVKLEGARP
jgi:SAM-dependent methyltransferase